MQSNYLFLMRGSFSHLMGWREIPRHSSRRSTVGRNSTLPHRTVWYLGEGRPQGAFYRRARNPRWVFTIWCCSWLLVGTLNGSQSCLDRLSTVWCGCRSVFAIKHTYTRTLTTSLRLLSLRSLLLLLLLLLFVFCPSFCTCCFFIILCCTVSYFCTLCRIVCCLCLQLLESF